MFLFRIGKEKWSYTLTMSLHKLKYSHVKELEGEHQFKFTMKRYIWRDTGRGNHKLNFGATINKKGRIHCDHKPQDIPMTLYYDKDTEKFNEKLVTSSIDSDDHPGQNIQWHHGRGNRPRGCLAGYCSVRKIRLYLKIRTWGRAWRWQR